jgi:hypothetical protein
MSVSDKAGKPFQPGNDPRRNPDGKFKPGNCGNPEGRRTINAEMKRKLYEALKGEDGLEPVYDWLIRIARDSENKRQLQAIELMMSYVHGKPTQIIATDEDSGPLQIVFNVPRPEGDHDA